VRIEINGEQREFAETPVFLSYVIEQMSLAPQRIAVEVNKMIVRRRDWPTTPLKDGDQIEIVHFVGGGQRQNSREATKPSDRRPDRT